MKDAGADRDLHTAFQAARSAERGAVPSYNQVRARRTAPRRRPRRSGWVLAIGAASAGVVLGVAVLLRAGAARADLELARRVMAWQSPTGFLLPPAGSLLLDPIPRLELSVPGSPLRALDPGGPLAPPPLRSPRL